MSRELVQEQRKAGEHQIVKAKCPRSRSEAYLRLQAPASDDDVSSCVAAPGTAVKTKDTSLVQRRGLRRERFGSGNTTDVCSSDP